MGSTNDTNKINTFHQSESKKSWYNYVSLQRRNNVLAIIVSFN